jgi:uncharacterized protein YutD
MDKIININEKEYELIKNIREGFDFEELKNKCTDYFDDYDYIVGDWAYGKLRLKGFYDGSNKKARDLNNIKFLDNYLKNTCAFNCKYFVIKRVYKK